MPRPNGKKIIFLCIGLAIFICIYSTNLVHKIIKRSQFSKESCTEIHNIAYLKTHKCASTSLQNIFFRYGLLHNLTFALPKIGNYFGVFVPFQAAMLPVHLRSPLELNIFAVHTVWNDKEVRSVMPNDTFFITAVRDPSDVFESLYSYSNSLGGNMTIERYIEEAPPDARYSNLGYNQMAFDFGVPVKQLTNITYIKEIIPKLDRNFDLILVSNRMEESLILLKNKLCWTHHQVVTFSLNARSKKFKTSLGKNTAMKLRSRLESDYLIYNHFYKKFQLLVQEFGIEEMQEEIQLLRKATEDLKTKCGIKEVDPDKEVASNNKMYSNKVKPIVANSTELECYIVETSELPLLKFTRQRQLKKLIKLGRINPEKSVELPMGSMVLDTSLKHVAEMMKNGLYILEAK